jgi:hypothetical protein
MMKKPVGAPTRADRRWSERPPASTAATTRDRAKTALLWPDPSRNERKLAENRGREPSCDRRENPAKEPNSGLAHAWIAPRRSPVRVRLAPHHRGIQPQRPARRRYVLDLRGASSPGSGCGARGRAASGLQDALRAHRLVTRPTRKACPSTAGRHRAAAAACAAPGERWREDHARLLVRARSYERSARRSRRWSSARRHRTRSVTQRVRPVLVDWIDKRADGVADRSLVQQREPGRPLGVVVAQRGHNALVLTLGDG